MESPSKYLLAIETSCDECSVAIVQRSQRSVEVLSHVVFSQIELHSPYGGIVPEIASRNHLEMLTPLIREALSNAKIDFKDLGAVGVTNRPGLIGALLVGVSAAKALSYARQIPLVAVDHLHGHIHSLFIDGQRNCSGLETRHLPLLVCLVSGGHTNLYLLRDLPPHDLNIEKLSESRDDAAGEAFDKCAKLMGLEYPGGKHIDRLAKLGNPRAFKFPRPLPGDTLEFSFSGLKTAMSMQLTQLGFKPHVFGDKDETSLPQGQVLNDLCASLQEAIVDVLTTRICRAIERTGAKGLAIVGGVSANSRLREKLSEKAKIPIFSPDLQYCTDNAAMIGAAAVFQWERGEALSKSEMLKLNAFSS